MSTAYSVLARLRVLGALLIALITCACAPQGNVRDVPSVAKPDPQALANAQLAAGNFAQAADAYETLAATSSGVQATRLRAMAVLAYQDAGDYATADGLLGLLEGTGGADGAIATARARALQQGGRDSEALALANTVDATPLTPYQRGILTRTRGRAALNLGDAQAAAPALIAAWRYPYPAAREDELRQQTWRAVSSLPESDLENGATAASADTQAAWYALALTARRSMLDTTTFAARAEDWRMRYPQHPAGPLIEALLERSEALGERPRHVALLLPFDATFGPAAEAIRDGFISAWFGDENVASRPRVGVYSTSDGDTDSVVNRALGDGAEFIVGPLRKELVDHLRADSDLDVGVLALNVVDDATLTRTGFYQFGLTPEDEAAQVAERAVGRGPGALLLAPDSSWGKRLMAAYQSAWNAVGGTVLASVHYNESTEGYTRAVRQALNIDLSQARAAALRERLNLPLHFEPRRRQDAAVILLAAYPGNARQLMPQLRYFGADSMPVYATSHVYAGVSSAEGDIDLDGIEFADMPWLFDAADRRSHAVVERYWAPRAAAIARLYAFGIDAYRVLPHLGKLRLQPGLRVPGVTGDLSMDARGVLHRKLTWMRYVNGTPRRADTLAARVLGHGAAAGE